MANPERAAANSEALPTTDPGSWQPTRATIPTELAARAAAEVASDAEKDNALSQEELEAQQEADAFVKANGGEDGQAEEASDGDGAAVNADDSAMGVDYGGVRGDVIDALEAKLDALAKAKKVLDSSAPDADEYDDNASYEKAARSHRRKIDKAESVVESLGDIDKGDAAMRRTAAVLEAQLNAASEAKVLPKGLRNIRKTIKAIGDSGLTLGDVDALTRLDNPVGAMAKVLSDNKALNSLLDAGSDTARWRALLALDSSAAPKKPAGKMAKPFETKPSSDVPSGGESAAFTAGSRMDYRGVLAVHNKSPGMTGAALRRLPRIGEGASQQTGRWSQ